ncbi:hypothetical protein ACLOJK_000103 [Asimina triloba]
MGPKYTVTQCTTGAPISDPHHEPIFLPSGGDGSVVNGRRSSTVRLRGSGSSGCGGRAAAAAADPGGCDEGGLPLPRLRTAKASKTHLLQGRRRAATDGDDQEGRSGRSTPSQAADGSKQATPPPNASTGSHPSRSDGQDLASSPN